MHFLKFNLLGQLMLKLKILGRNSTLCLKSEVNVGSQLHTPLSCGSVEWNTVDVVVMFVDADASFFARNWIVSQLNIVC
jgi:hypothetical protein